MGEDDAGVEESGASFFGTGGEDHGVEPGPGRVVNMEGDEALEPFLKVVGVPDHILDLEKPSVGEDHPEVTPVEVGDHGDVGGVVEVESTKL